MEKVSLITTVLNERTDIDTFLNSIAAQTIQPDEVIIVDGGSTDGTVDHVKRFIKAHPELHAQLVIEPGNIAHGRNKAIQKTRHVIIAVSDAGCILHPDWLKHLIWAFKMEHADVAAGYYIPTGSSFFQKCLATYTSVMPDRLDSTTFLPSSRSIAFTKQAWEKVGGYPEHLDTAEDLVFARNMKRAGLRMVPAFSALVDWPQRSTWRQAFWQFFHYAQGDGKAFYIRRQTPLLWGRIILGTTLIGYVASVHSNISVMLFGVYSFLYWFFAVAKNWRYVPNWRATLYLPALQAISDVAVFSGMISGFLKRYEKR